MTEMISGFWEDRNALLNCLVSYLFAVNARNLCHEMVSNILLCTQNSFEIECSSIESVIFPLIAESYLCITGP